MNFKEELSRVFDDNLHTKQWHNIVDHCLFGLILLSTLQVFLSTYDVIVEKYGLWLNIVDYFTTIIFTIEVTLRIWAADLIDEKYKGFWGRIRYCFSFYGFIDIISTYPFYLHFFMQIPYVVLKAFRVARLLRIFRYMKAFNVLSRAISSKKQEMVVSLQFLAIVTVILSFVLFFVENKVQPDVYDNGWTSVVWAFAQYIGDPGGFADTPPITTCGRIIACIIGVLGIAIFAVPAGLIGSAFTEVMEEDKREESINEWRSRLYQAFERKLDRPTTFQIVPRWVSISEIMVRLGLKEDEIFDVVEKSNNFRLINLATTQPADCHPVDKIAVEHFRINTSYGYCIDRGSKITINTPSNPYDAIMGWWGYYLAYIGGFNYISREIGPASGFNSFYLYKPEKKDPGRDEYMADMNRLLNNEDKWIFTILAASGSQEPTFPTQFHFAYGAKKGDETYDDPNITLNDVPTFEKFYQSFSKILEEKYSLSSDKQRYHNNSVSTLFARHLDHKVNAISLRVAWSVTCWDMRAIQIVTDLANCINEQILGKTEINLPPQIKVKAIGYDEYDETIN